MARCWHVTSRAKSPRNNIQPPPHPTPTLRLSSLFSCCRFFCSVLVIVYQAGQTKRAVGNWVSHLLPDMIDKSPPSAISAKLLFRRAAARFTLASPRRPSRPPSSPPTSTPWRCLLPFVHRSPPSDHFFLRASSFTASRPATSVRGQIRSRKCIRNKFTPPCKLLVTLRSSIKLFAIAVAKFSTLHRT